jgi:hypothetical protein
MRGLDSVGQLQHAVRRVLTLRPDVGRHRAERLVQDAMWPQPGRGPKPATLLPRRPRSAESQVRVAAIRLPDGTIRRPRE